MIYTMIYYIIEYSYCSNIKEYVMNGLSHKMGRNHVVCGEGVPRGVTVKIW